MGLLHAHDCGEAHAARLFSERLLLGCVKPEGAALGSEEAYQRSLWQVLFEEWSNTPMNMGFWVGLVRVEMMLRGSHGLHLR